MKNVLPLILGCAEKIASKYFEGYEEFYFWYSMGDFSRWLRNFKIYFPSEYDEFILACEEGNPLLDFRKYTENQLKKKFGDNFVIKSYFFRLSVPGLNKLSGNFLDWLLNGISTGKFSILKNLPKSIDKYYQNEDFKTTPIVSKKKEKNTIDIDSVVF
jgi:hypothetical protein